MQLNIFKKKKSFRKGGLHLNPDVYWQILLGLAFTVIIASFVFGFFLFKTVNKEFVLSDENNGGQVKAISKERIDKALEYFSAKNEKAKEILNSPSPIIDPSR